METVIKWNEGDGNIVATYNGSGNGTIVFSSDIANKGIDRTLLIKITTDNLSIDVKINLIGLREVFNTSNEEFILMNNCTFNVLKS